MKQGVKLCSKYRYGTRLFNGFNSTTRLADGEEHRNSTPTARSATILLLWPIPP